MNNGKDNGLTLKENILPLTKKIMMSVTKLFSEYEQYESRFFFFLY